MVTPEMIQAFLSVVECGNITLAANNLYTTQSNLSKQIKLLENELGVELLIRKKGHSSVSLTPYGKHFLQLSRDWESLMKEIYDLKNTRNITEVSIGALDRLNSFTLTDFYNQILDQYTDIRIDTHTRHSRELYRMMEASQLDIALVTGIMPVSNLTVTPLYKEPMFVVCSKDTQLGKIVHPSDLDPDKEVFSRWSDEFEIWHDQYWPGKQYRIHVGTTSMTPDYLNQKGRWSIMPVSTL
ncbi:MAG: LysR family transcriptional regulator, partial [Solobacterium sp.]|nr:LysR family transcriptional regulator [Solobacterium sp.]